MTEAEETLELATFGELLKLFRKRKRISQQQLAGKLGIHRNTISTWERGDFLPESRSMILELARVLTLTEQEAQQLLAASLNTISSYWLVPHARNPFFSGRATILHELRRLLTPGKSGSSMRSYALRGLAGIGKTQIALEYAYRYAQEYTAVFWIEAETRASLLKSYAAIARQLHLEDVQQPDEVVALVQQWLALHTNWLLIFDNVDDVGLVKTYMPAARRGAILMTTRLHAAGGLARSIDVPLMDVAEGMQLLCQRTSFNVSSEGDTGEYPVVSSIVNLLQGLPLALDQAGAYREQTSCSVSELFHLLSTQPLTILRERETYADHPASVVRTFLLAFERVRQSNPDAAELLTLYAFLAADGINEELLPPLAPALSPALQTLLLEPVLYHEALKTLLQYSLLQRDAENRTIALHRLVQAVLRDTLSAPQRMSWLNRLIDTFERLFPDYITDEQYWLRCEQLYPHVFSCLRLADQDRLRTPGCMALRAKAIMYLLVRGWMDEVDALWPSDEQLQHTQSAYSLNILASVAVTRGRFQQAEDLYKQAMQIRKQAGDEEHADIAMSLQGLGMLARERGEYLKAQTLLVQALQMYERICDNGHPWIGVVLYELALLFIAQGGYEQATAYLQRALAIWEQAASTDHPFYTLALNGLANMYNRQGRYQEAAWLFQRVLRGHTSSRSPYAPYHPNRSNDL